MEMIFKNISLKRDNDLVVENVSFPVENGKITGILGPNGSGKSTLLRSATRVLRPYNGSVVLNGRDIWSGYSARSFAKHVSVVNQINSQTVPIKVLEFVKLGRIPYRSMFGNSTKIDEKISYEALESVSMESYAFTSINHLSGGELQRVLLARALAQQPEILILDEPTNHLDACSQYELLDLIRNLELTTLVVLHDLTLASQYCDFIFLLKNGQLVNGGPPIEVLSPETVLSTFNVRSEQIYSPKFNKIYIALARNRDDS